jgi:carbonic anhydrase
MLTFTNDIVRDLLSNSLQTARIEDGRWEDVGTDGGSTAGDYIEWLTIRDLKQSVLVDVTRIRTHPLVPNTIPIYGYIYDVTNGQLIEVPEASKVSAQARAARN